MGRGTAVGGNYENFSDITWETDPHFVKVEIKFASDYLEMGIMQFLSVPYALYAGRSLEPGPEGPQGPPGDPASDDQTLSFDGANMSISGGNTVNLQSLVNDPNDEIQYLSIAGDSLSITRGNSIKLQEINIDDADADPTNEIQTLNFNAVESKLQITGTGGNEVNLSSLINTDNQQLTYNPLTHLLTITNGGAAVDLSDLKNDADASSSNELISSFNLVGTQLVINEGAGTHSVDLSGNMIAFRAEKNISTTGLSLLTDYDFIPGNIRHNDGNGYSSATGIFTAPLSGIYTFNVGYYANGSGDIRKLYLFINNSLFETLQTNITSGVSFVRSITVKLDQFDEVKVVYNTGSAQESGTGSFSGFKVY